MTDQTETDRPGLPVEQAAAAMDTPVGTFRRWMRRTDFPVVRAGQRGRGHAALVDVAKVREWRARVAAAPAGGAGLQAEELPGVLGQAFAEAFRKVEGPDKRRTAGLLAASWHTVATNLLEILRDRGQDVPEINALPEQIEQLLKIAHEVDSF